MQVGITERGDSSLDLGWANWVSKGNPAILITKDPASLHGHLKRFPAKEDLNIITHCTITGYGGTTLEPNAPLPSNSLLGYISLINLLGPERIVLRIDPVIATEDGLDKAKDILRRACDIYPPGTRVRISFLDMYPHVKERFIKAGIPLPHESFHASLKTRLEYWEELGRPEVCGEPGMECTGCISSLDCQTLGITPAGGKSQQRAACACLSMKRELLSRRGRCSLKCLYCYWQG